MSFFFVFRKEVGRCRTKSSFPSCSTVIYAQPLASQTPSSCYRATCTCSQNLKRWHKSWSPKGCFYRRLNPNSVTHIPIKSMLPKKERKNVRKKEQKSVLKMRLMFVSAFRWKFTSAGTLKKSKKVKS